MQASEVHIVAEAKVNNSPKVYLVQVVRRSHAIQKQTKALHE